MSDEVVAVPVDENEQPQSHETKTPSKVTKTPSKSTPKNGKSPASPKISYIQLVHDAIVALKDRTGSSQVAIQKYILANYPHVSADKLKQRLLLTLKTGVTNKRFVKFKASFKIHPDCKKSPSSKKADRKKLTKEQLAAQREKERQEAKEKERLDRIRKRKFPMDDLALIAEDKELKVSVSVPPRPTLSHVLPGHVSACKSDSMGTGLLDDAFHIYHFFRGDIGWARFPNMKDVIAPFTLQHWMECIQQVLRGGAKRSRMLPPLMTHLFVVALQHLVPNELQVGLTPASWSEVVMLYMDAMERFYTSEPSLDSSALPGLGIDTEYLVGATNEPKDETMLQGPTVREKAFYLQGPLLKIHAKLYATDPWMLSADELLALLKMLVDDLLATQEECADLLDERMMESYDLLKRKREADANFRKVQTIRRKEQNEEKERREKDEKATRSNTKLPTVSEAQVEAARRAQQKAADAYDKACRSMRVRTEPIGSDRHHHALFHFWNDPQHVYVLQKGKNMPSQLTYNLPGLEVHRTTWYSINKRSVLEEYMESLDVRGKRECQLEEALQPTRKMVEDDVKAASDRKSLLKDKRELERRMENARIKCELGRKSGRLAAQSEQELSDLQTEIDTFENAMSGEAVESKPDLTLATGLQLIRDFDSQDDQQQRRRATRREVQKQEEEEEYERVPHLPCSRLWSTGNIDGTGIVGGIVWDLLELEQRVQQLAKWETGDRKSWIANLETAVHSWHLASPPQLEESRSTSPIASPGSAGDAKRQKLMNGTPSSVASSGSNVAALSAPQIVALIKHPLLDIEQRIYDLTGLAVAARDADLADDNMSTNPEETQEKQLQIVWKKIIHRMNRLPAKAHTKIRQAVVEAIAAARKAQQAVVVAQLREALLQFHPDAAGACKAAALEILEKNGGYEEDDEDEEEEAEEGEGDSNDGPVPKQSEATLSSMLSLEAVILNSSLDGQEDVSRADWIVAVKKTKTISKLAAFSAAFCAKASEKLSKLEAEQSALHSAIEIWEKAAGLRKKSAKSLASEPSEIWCNVNFTDDFCLVKVESYPWWPAKKCLVKDEALSASLKSLGRTVVSLVGESGGLRVVKADRLVPFAETPPNDEDLSSQPKEIKTQLDECMQMARRIFRGTTGEQTKASKPMISAENGEIKEEKKLAM